MTKNKFIELLTKNFSYKNYEEKIKFLAIFLFTCFGIIFVGLIGTFNLLRGNTSIGVIELGLVCIALIINILLVAKGAYRLGAIFMVILQITLTFAIVYINQSFYSLFFYIFSTFIIGLSVNFFYKRKYFFIYIFVIIFSIFLLFIIKYNSMITLLSPNDKKIFFQILVPTIALFIIGIFFMLLNDVAYNNLKKDFSDNTLVAQEKVVKMNEIIKNVEGAISIGDKLNNISDNIGEKIFQVKDMVENVYSASENFNLSVNALSKIISAINNEKDIVVTQITEQNVAFEETHAEIEEIQGSISTMSETSNSKIELLNVIAGKVSEGVKSLDKSMKSFDLILSASAQMVDVIAMIENIAKKTNMLAMNASIEAAHAGEYGKGFSVVAEEIRVLAEETAENSSKIESMIKKNNQDIEMIVDITKTSSNDLKPIVKSIFETADEFKALGQGLAELSRGANEISKASVNIASLNKLVINSVDKMDSEMKKSEDMILESQNSFNLIVDNINEAKNSISGINDDTDILSKVANSSSDSVKNILENLDKI